MNQRTALHAGRSFLEELDRLSDHQARVAITNFLTLWVESSSLQIKAGRLRTIGQWLEGQSSDTGARGGRGRKGKRGGRGRGRGSGQGRVKLDAGKAVEENGEESDDTDDDGDDGEANKDEDEGEVEGVDGGGDEVDNQGDDREEDEGEDEGEDGGEDEGEDGGEDEGEDGGEDGGEDEVDNQGDDGEEDEGDDDGVDGGGDKADLRDLRATVDSDVQSDDGHTHVNEDYSYGDENDDLNGDQRETGGEGSRTDTQAGLTKQQRSDHIDRLLDRSIDGVVRPRQGPPHTNRHEGEARQDRQQQTEKQLIPESAVEGQVMPNSNAPGDNRSQAGLPVNNISRNNDDNGESTISKDLVPRYANQLPPPAPLQMPLSSRTTTTAAQDIAGLGHLAIATRIPDPPLRLTASYCDSPSLYRMVEAVLSTNKELSSRRQGDIANFIASFYDPASYWKLHTNMTKLVEKTGFVQAHLVQANDINCRKDSLLSLASSTAFSIDSRTDPDLNPPKCLTMLVKQWRDTVEFSQHTSTPAVTRIVKMRQEEQLYVYWCSIRALWRDSDLSQDSQNPYLQEYVDDADDDESPLAPTDTYLEYPDPSHARTDAEALAAFLLAQMEQRKEELGLKRMVRWERHSVKLLRSLVAPFLGLNVNMTDRTWYTTIGMGQAVYTISQGLGWGALALVKRENIRLIGARILERILPIITAHDPQLKALLHSIEKNFLDLRLHKLDVERFLRIGSIEQLIRVCSANANGLDGILGVPSGFNLDNQGLMDVGSAVPSTGAPASTSDDEDAVYNIQELLGSGRDSAAELGGVGIRQRRHSPTGQRRLSPTGPAALPTPPTTLEKIGTKRGVGPQSEESPTKRR